MRDHLLLTGATGLLGRYLLRDLLLAGQKVAVLVRGTRKAAAVERVEEIMAHWEAELGHSLPRPVCFEGDVCQSEFGLDANGQRWLAENCAAILHSAASLTFHRNGEDEPYRTNVGGTQNVLNVCRLAGIKKLHYISTAYVCGMRSGLVREADLDVGQSFRNDYERAKLEAETLVRKDDFLEELTVYRPAVIAGDSQTGFTNTYHGLYLYLRLVAMFVPQQELDEHGRRFTPIRLPMTGNEGRNVVPVDWVSEVIAHLVGAPQAHGRTFHLAPEKCITPREIVDAAYNYFNSTGVQYVGDQPIDPATYSEFEASILPSLGIYENYSLTDPNFDRSNLVQFAGHLPCPVLDQEMLHRYIKYGEEDRWGKRKTPVPIRPAATESQYGGAKKSESLEFVDAADLA